MSSFATPLCTRGGAWSCSAGPRCRLRRRGWRARRDRESASSRTMTALFPPSSRSDRPSRFATVSPTARPIAQLPVADTSGMRSSSAMRAPSGRPPHASAKIGGCPIARAVSAAIRVHRDGRERRLLRRLPHDGVAAHRRDERVPRPHRRGEVERRERADDAERVPLLEHAVIRALRVHREARRAGARGRPRSRRCRSSPAPRPRPRRGSSRSRARSSAPSSFFFSRSTTRDASNELAAARGRHRAPREERRVRRCDGVVEVVDRRLQHGEDRRARRRVHRHELIPTRLRHPLTRVHAARRPGQTQRIEDRLHGAALARAVTRCGRPPRTSGTAGAGAAPSDRRTRG